MAPPERETEPGTSGIVASVRGAGSHPEPGTIGIETPPTEPPRQCLRRQPAVRSSLQPKGDPPEPGTVNPELRTVNPEL
jgi:hypothetical protein